MCSPSSSADWDDEDLNNFNSPQTETDYNYMNNNNINNCTETENAKMDSIDENFNNGDDLILHYYYAPTLEAIDSTVKWAFLVHSYGFACLFFFLAFYAFFSILNLRSQLSSRPYMSTINSFLCLLGVSRAAVLFIDPYGLKKTLPVLMGTLIWDLGFPCLVSSFSLIQIAFLQLTQSVPEHKLCQMSPPNSSVFIVSHWNYNKPYMQLEVGPEKLRKKTCLSIIITMHFVTVIASAIYSNVNSDLLIVKFVFQLGFAIWGFLLCGCFLYAGKRVLGLLGFTSGTGEPGQTVVNEKGVAGLMMASLMAPGQNLASSLTAALAPTLLQSSTPKIKITDENDRTISVASDSSRINENLDGPPRPSTPVPGTSKSNGQANSKDGIGRPGSPVLPRKKSGGNSSSLRNCSAVEIRSSNKSRRLSFRRDSSSNENELFTATRKKSLTWSENESGSNNTSSKNKRKIEEDGCGGGSLTVNSDKSSRRGSRKSADYTATANETNNLNSERGGTESLLGAVGQDYTLQSILSHIAYVNQTALDYRLGRKLSRKNQVQKVIKYTSLTALLGVLLCVGEIIRILSPFGMLASTISPPKAWPWFVLQTICRAIEFGMGAVIANITKQPVSRPPHHLAYSFRHKHPRDSLYL